MALTQKQMAFLEDYAVSGNISQSYAKFYHNQTRNSNAWKILKSEEAQEYLNYLRTQLHNERIANLEECLERLTTIIREGEKNEVLKAIDMRLKSLGAYVSKSEVSIDTPTTIKVSIQEEEK